MEPVTANSDLARQLRDQADDAMHHRKALLCVSVALAETTTVAAARKALAEWPGPARVKHDAVELLDELTTEETAP
jgi:hypothetical protein